MVDRDTRQKLAVLAQHMLTPGVVRSNDVHALALGVVALIDHIDHQERAEYARKSGPDDHDTGRIDQTGCDATGEYM